MDGGNLRPFSVRRKITLTEKPTPKTSESKAVSNIK